MKIRMAQPYGDAIEISDYRRIFYWYTSSFLFIGKYLSLLLITLHHFEFFDFSRIRTKKKSQVTLILLNKNKKQHVL